MSALRTPSAPLSGRWPASLKILVVPGSIRGGSRNVRLAATVAAAFAEAGAEATRVSLADFPLPIYDADLEAGSGVPEPAVDLARMIGVHHGVVLVSPEYNSAPPPLLKNAIDWLTRVRGRDEAPGEVLRGRPFALASASNGRFGGARSLMMLRLILAGCRITVIPDQLALSFADDGYDDMDRLRLESDNDMLRAMVARLIDVAGQMRHHD
ncbi:MAG: NAD(P)H-dependent oxidoreductase [Xanthobacteraceae bacterium]|nr:NAD(P)H-dependent oxidoreductase [Xanthobacteraceae bacterium]